jgi:hypothetical protein
MFTFVIWCVGLCLMVMIAGLVIGTIDTMWKKITGNYP